KIAVLGDMLELGEYGVELRKKVGEEVVKNKIDILRAVGSLAKYIAEEAIALGMRQENVQYLATKEEAIKILNTILTEKNNGLIKASNFMKFYQIVEYIK